MKYKLHKNGSYNIHTIKTDKFKTIRMEIIFRNNFNSETTSSRTALFELLTENSKNYKTKRSLNLKEEELYNAVIYSESIKLGNQIISSINLEFLNPKFTKDEYFEEALALPFDLIFNPNIKGEEFDADTLEVVKKRLISELSNIQEDPKKKAIVNALEFMDPKSISSKNIVGTKKQIEDITPTQVYKEYIHSLNHDYIDIFIIGDFEESTVIDLINKYAHFKTIKNHKLDLFVNNKVYSKMRKKTDKSADAQSQIIYIYNTISLNEYERKYIMQIYNMILGGGALETKLAQNLRNKNSLCYGVQSIYNKYDNLLIITTSVDKDNIEKAKKLIQSSVNEMKKEVTEEELTHAITSSISSVNMAFDYQNRIIANYLFNYMAELDPMDIRISKYKEVTLKDVKNLSKKIKLNTIYVLEGDFNEEN